MTSVEQEVTRREVLRTLQAEQAAAVERLTPDPEEQRAAQIEAITRQAVSQTHRLAEQAKAIDSDLLASLNDVRDVKAKVKSGAMTSDEGVQRLRKVRATMQRLSNQRQALGRQYEQAQVTLKDPAAAVERLVSKYPSLRV